MAVIETNNLVRNYKLNGSNLNEGTEVKVIKGLDLLVEEGDFIAIMGKSGCGKTTLMKLLGFIDKPTSGEIIFKGRSARQFNKDEVADIRRKEIGFVFQDFYLMDSLTVKENIMLPMILEREETNKILSATEGLGKRFEISHLLNKNTCELSGGEKQRVAICRALINEPDLILADEPTGNLDSKSAQIVIDSLMNINKDMKKTIILVTHDAQIASYCKKVIFLKDGNIIGHINKEHKKEEFYNDIIRMIKKL
ncbi:ABC transporter ATP-binding protein [Clostridium botulinum]|uniref:ABC transporter, ATP-binding protein n=1 Tax=Clostridium botulinum (strain Hall / ATCC 3502 / NCTC 13319 / Type A) TaxID=441771 RepID=A5I6P5_CLOBH|nr:ABC transporter ATP-binding protein [Clostridium botulinum]ABS34412.1 ABC transporter, ATP-binding protein [Clostridium botulinum A str. ATCC 19397]ABS38716.1 ABC transporter, ATP-binding protein [Clostridium botulinum A str. Hall]AWB18978.1 ABC transporter ATP-binding protein [Clostridium botulinum]AWB31791.1 ABC transporter ATP-binding protein [Clostridium botulinum]EGT5617024.1 ABC transporter ATP-binding protein [Clostridium botulinum]